MKIIYFVDFHLTDYSSNIFEIKHLIKLMPRGRNVLFDLHTEKTELKRKKKIIFFSPKTKRMRKCIVRLLK